MSDMDAWKNEVQELLFQDQSYWEFYAYRAARSSAEARDLLHSTRTHIALTYIHKLAS